MEKGDKQGEIRGAVSPLKTEILSGNDRFPEKYYKLYKAYKI